VKEKRKFVAGPVASFPPGTNHRVDIGGKNIAIFNVSGTFYALRDICPHQGAALSSGVVISSISSNHPGEYDFQPNRKFVRCPWHGWDYDLATGQSWCEPGRNRVRPFPISVESGEALLDDDNGACSPVRGPYVAETISISVRDDYVVIEV
jgi:nitrite reductase/ring-hydroxylating ferredoxin subunit